MEIQISSIRSDRATAQELAQAMTEADTEEGVSVEEAFARLPPRKRTA